MDPPSMPIPSPDGDVAANPPGFDRDAFLKQLGDEVTAFFDKPFPLTHNFRLTLPHEI
ncbi:MAG: hypothetical protein ABI699_00080 [Caldimonas sp.]